MWDLCNQLKSLGKILENYVPTQNFIVNDKCTRCCNSNKIIFYTFSLNNREYKLKLL